MQSSEAAATPGRESAGAPERLRHARVHVSGYRHTRRRRRERARESARRWRRYLGSSFRPLRLGKRGNDFNAVAEPRLEPSPREVVDVAADLELGPRPRRRLVRVHVIERIRAGAPTG